MIRDSSRQAVMAPARLVSRAIGRTATHAHKKAPDDKSWWLSPSRAQVKLNLDERSEMLSLKMRMMTMKLSLCFASILLAAVGCADGGDASSNGGDAGSANTRGDSQDPSSSSGSTGGSANGTSTGGATTGEGETPIIVGPDSRDIPAFGEPGFDPSVDPGVDSVFIDDPELNRGEDYVYVATQAGDHDLPAGIVAIDYDVMGSDNLQTVLSSHLTELQGGYGLALYLLNGTELNDTDLDFLQMLHDESEGLGLDNLDTLHVYNLKSLRGGVESDSVTASGNPNPFLWANGWQAPTSERMKGDGGWVKHIVMDDLEEIKAGTFCDTMFESMSFKGVKIIREMGFGFRPRAKMSYIYLPSVELIETHAFRRSQYLLKVNLPKVKTIEEFAFDDNSRLEYFSAPELEWIGRNGLNDTHELISVHLPKLEYIGINCFDLQYRLTILRLPSVTEVRDNGLTGFEVLKFAYLPSVTDLNSRTMINCIELEAVYLGEDPPEQGTNAFTNTSDNLTIYYSGDDPGWESWIPSGNESAPVVQK